MHQEELVHRDTHLSPKTTWLDVSPLQEVQLRQIEYPKLELLALIDPRCDVQDLEFNHKVEKARNSSVKNQMAFSMLVDELINSWEMLGFQRCSCPSWNWSPCSTWDKWSLYLLYPLSHFINTLHWKQCVKLAVSKTQRPIRITNLKKIHKDMLYSKLNMLVMKNNSITLEGWLHYFSELSQHLR